MPPVPKPPKPFRSKKYRAFVSDHKCGRRGCKNLAPTHPHHAGIGFDEKGWNHKIPDTRCVPRCLICHTPLEHNGYPTPRSELLVEMIALMREYISMNGWECPEVTGIGDREDVKALSEYIEMMEAGKC